MRRALTRLATLTFFWSGTAHAQDVLDVGMLKESDIHVVQKMLHPKAGKMEMGAHLGWMPFDTYTTTPMLNLSGGLHLNETRAVEVSIGGGYSLKNANYKILESATYGITPDAYRYLASALVDYQVSPVYAKLNWFGKRVFHHDLYGLGGLGLTVERAFMPDASIAIAPTLGLGIGTRIFLKDGGALRIQIRDDLLYQQRVKTLDSQGWFLKQNVSLSVGYVRLKER
jgi:outer membrane beta-barrel protein